MKMGKRQLNKKEAEEQRKKEEEHAAAQAYEEYMTTFQEGPAKTGKVWVKGGNFDAGKRQEDVGEKGKLYKPTSRFESIERPPNTTSNNSSVTSKSTHSKSDKPGKKKEREKKKSNLELFKEELRMIQEEREERHKYKGIIKSTKHSSISEAHPVEPPPSTSGGGGSVGGSSSASMSADEKYGSYDCGDPNTTNLYLGNLNPKISEQQLMETFGRYGPLASIKIMWPRSDEEKARGRNCGFVAFMNRKDGERSLKALNGKDVLNYEMKLGWGKAIPIPAYPIYIPPKMQELTQPPPPSGLPFNAQYDKPIRMKLPRPGSPPPQDSRDREEFEKILSQAIVKVVIPTERNLLALIHRMVEFVVREGPLFEAMIMNKEMHNPMFRFLFENPSPAHVYYRWKLFSVLHGDTPQKWRTKELRIYKGGSGWKPPVMNPYTQGMPDELVSDDEREPLKGKLSDAQHCRLVNFLRVVIPDRFKIAEVMIYCIDHADAADEICQCILESVSAVSTTLHKKIARLYVVSDILHNCTVKVSHASSYRKCFETKLPDIFHQMMNTYNSIEERLRADTFKQRVMHIFRTWEDWAIYPQDYLIRLQNVFLGLATSESVLAAKLEDEEVVIESKPVIKESMDDLDGIPLDGEALLKSAILSAEEDRKVGRKDNIDIDGVPLDEDFDGRPLDDEEESTPPNKSNSPKKLPPGFVPSKWETVDPEELQAQAVTTSKWDLLDAESDSENKKSTFEYVDDIDGVPMQEGENSVDLQEDDDDTIAFEDREMTEDRRNKLREIEVKVMQYQDELESGHRSVKSGHSIIQQVSHYRKKLLRKAERNERDRETNEAKREREDKKEHREERTTWRERSDRSNKRSASPDTDHHTTKKKSRSPQRPKTKHSRSSSPSPMAHKRSSRRSRSRSPKRSRRSGSRSAHGRSKSRSPSSRRHRHRHKHRD